MSSTESKTPQESIFFIISSFAYLPNAEIALGQIKVHHPHAKSIIFITERDLGEYICPLPDVEVISVFDIGISDIDMMAFSYDILEFNTAVKPFCFLYLMGLKNYNIVIYIDSDIYIVSPLEEAFKILKSETAQIILTPHALNATEDAEFPSDIHLLQSGVFNLGFLAVRNGEDSLRFMAWWARKTRFFCKIDVKNGLFTDQKWCDLVPCLFSGVYILRHAGYNVAYWNLMHRIIERNAEGVLLSGGESLRFFHFSKLPTQNDNVLSSIQSRIAIDDLSFDAQEIIKAYREALIKANAPKRCLIPSDFGAIEHIGDGYIINGLKNIYDQYVLKTKISFALFIANCTVSNHATSSLGIHAQGCTDIVMACYDARGDLQSAFPKTEIGMHTLLHWVSLHFFESFNIKGKIKNSTARYLELTKCFVYDHVIDDELLSPSIRRVIEDIKNDDIERFWRILKGFASNFAPVAVDGSHGVKIPELFLAIWEGRPDLKKAFNIYQKNGAKGFVEWLYYRLQEEYGHSAWLVDLLEIIYVHPFEWSNITDQSFSEKSRYINKNEMLNSKMKELESYGYLSKEQYSVFSLR